MHVKSNVLFLAPQVWDVQPRTLPNAPRVVAAFPVIDTPRVYLSIRTGGGFENEGESVVRTDLSSGERRVLASFELTVDAVVERGDAIIVNLRDGGMGLRSLVVLNRQGRSRTQIRGAYVSAYPRPNQVTISYLAPDGRKVRATKTVDVATLLK